MPKPRPLRPDELARTLVGRFERKPGGQPGLADKLRQLHTKFGARSRRVFLCWYRWTGEEEGEGQAVLLREIEILPTPLVSDLTAILRNPYSAGQLPVGTVRVDEVSAAIAEDTLLGRLAPGGPPIEGPVVFFFEIAEDGRSGAPALRNRYRLAGAPSRKETDVCWTLLLERASNDRTRPGVLSGDPLPTSDR
jgi:hypothetical protein